MVMAPDCVSRPLPVSLNSGASQLFDYHQEVTVYKNNFKNYSNICHEKLLQGLDDNTFT